MSILLNYAPLRETLPIHAQWLPACKVTVRATLNLHDYQHYQIKTRFTDCSHVVNKKTQFDFIYNWSFSEGQLWVMRFTLYRLGYNVDVIIFDNSACHLTWTVPNRLGDFLTGDTQYWMSVMSVTSFPRARKNLQSVNFCLQLVKHFRNIWQFFCWIMAGMWCGPVLRLNVWLAEIWHDRGSHRIDVSQLTWDEILHL